MSFDNHLKEVMADLEKSQLKAKWFMLGQLCGVVALVVGLLLGKLINSL